MLNSSKCLDRQLNITLPLSQIFLALGPPLSLSIYISIYIINIRYSLISNRIVHQLLQNIYKSLTYKLATYSNNINIFHKAKTVYEIVLLNNGLYTKVNYTQNNYNPHWAARTARISISFSLSIHSDYSSLPAGHPNHIQCPYRSGRPTLARLYRGVH